MQISCFLSLNQTPVRFSEVRTACMAQQAEVARSAAAKSAIKENLIRLSSVPVATEAKAQLEGEFYVISGVLSHLNISDNMCHLKF
ncbi:unnamed protein product [Protopolystoma xenopodis]|uniref:Uncharacterized protein n=1 Tax=Protopolystoma xenopodis TaxID=117903 RepID=A0A3S5BSA9_9PLAT|nr:unnamed protein product [Protopolystoma xenopodis]